MTHVDSAIDALNSLLRGELAAAAATTDFFRRRRWHGEAEIRMAYLNTLHTHLADTTRAAGHVVD